MRASTVWECPRCGGGEDAQRSNFVLFWTIVIDKMRLIKICDGNNEAINLQVEDNSITLDLIKTYFPSAISLTYKVDDNKIGLQ